MFTKIIDTNSPDKIVSVLVKALLLSEKNIDSEALETFKSKEDFETKFKIYYS